MSSSLRIIVTGLIAQHPRLGGVTWDYLQYVVGLARLGHDVYYFEDSGEWPYSFDGGPAGSDWILRDCTPNIEHLIKVFSRFGLEDRWAYRFPVKPEWFGLSHKKRREVLETADILINVSGTLKKLSDYRMIPRLIYIDSDPVFTQVKLQLNKGQKKFQKRVAAHDVFFSFGESFSDQIPETIYQWHPTRQPIVLSEWRVSPPQRPVFTTVMSWASYKPLRFQGKSYAQKDVEFKQFIDLPKEIEKDMMEVAIGSTRHTNWETHKLELPDIAANFIRQHPEWTVPELLRHTGWQVDDAYTVCADMDSYRSYIESSKAEWSIAKNGYVAGQSGWFSCRSACYLAAGKPVVVQDTGFTKVLPTGEGILPFRTKEEAIEAIHEVQRNYATHANAARLIAEEYFDSSRVLTHLIEEIMNIENKEKQGDTSL
jgi:hypothetical protein